MQSIPEIVRPSSGIAIPTPLGDYNPDWALLWVEDGDEKVYFVCESKGTMLENQLRGAE